VNWDEWISVVSINSPLFLAVTSRLSITFLLIFIVFLLILSFFISSAGVAFFSLHYKDFSAFKAKQEAAWKRVLFLLEQPQLLRGSLRLANILVNIMCILLMDALYDQVFPPVSSGLPSWVHLLIKFPLIAGVVLLFAEILPKIRAGYNPIRAAYESSFIAEIFFYLFRRITAWLMAVAARMEALLGLSTGPEQAQQHIEEVIRSTVQEEEEQRMLTGIYQFPNITVKQIMRSRLDVCGVEYTVSFGALKQRIEELHYSRLPVFKKDLDEIVGIIHTKDCIGFLHEQDAFDWHRLMRNPYFVHEQKLIEDLLKEFQTKRIHFAVVVDEFGGTSGIVTMEDILEEITGDIKDEFDEDESGLRRLDDGSYVLEGRMMIHDACEALRIPPDTFDSVKGTSDSVAGLILERAGEIPKAGYTLAIGDFVFTILELDRNRIHKLKLEIRSSASSKT
jgi:gliding motility-associated protein GldE